MMSNSPFPASIPQSKQVTVLYLPLPDAAASFPLSLHSRLAAIVTRYGGTLDSSPTDPPAFVALFGATIAQENDPRRALRAALAMQAEFGPLGRQGGGSRVPLRIGISTGSVLLTESAEGGYSAAGNPVQMAARVSEQVPEAGGVAISQATFRHVEGFFNVSRLPMTGWASEKSHALYLVVEERPFAFGSPRGEGEHVPLIGREPEQQTLRQAFAAAVAEQHLRIVTVVGEAGVGKSRLAHEFSRWLEEQAETVRFFKGRVSPQRGNQPYALARDFFAFRFGIQGREQMATASAKLEQGMHPIFTNDGRSKAQVIGHLLGFDFADSPALHGLRHDARLLRDRAFQHIAEFFQAVTTPRTRAVRLMGSAGGQGERPVVVMFLEDLHWADEGSLELVEYLAHTCQELPMLLVCLARPLLWERHPTWGRDFPPSHHTYLTLAPLSEAESHLLTTHLLHRVPEIPPELSHLLVSRTDGNPYYLEELVKMLMDDGVIVAPEGGTTWAVASQRLATVRVPTTLTGVLQARLDALPLAELELLQRASVVGRLFWEGALRRLYEDEPTLLGDIEEALAALEQKGILSERPPLTFEREREFLFTHALMQEVAYQGVSAAQRSGYHRQVARWLIEVSGEASGEGSAMWAGQIAEQFERGDEKAEAAAWFGQAAATAKASYVPATAIESYQRALTLLQDDTSASAQRVTLCEGLGDMLLQRARYQEAITAFEAMRGAAAVCGNRLAEARSWNLESQVHDDLAHVPPILACAERAEQILADASTEDIPSQRELANTLYRKGWALYRLGKPEAALQMAERSMRLSRVLGKVAQRQSAYSHWLVGVVHMILAHFEQADSHMEQARALFESMSDLRWTGRTWNGLGENARLHGDYALAVTRYRSALSYATKAQNLDWEIAYRSNLIGALVGLGKYQEAEAEAQRMFGMAGPEKRAGLAEPYRFLSEAYLGQGKWEEALEHAELTLRLSQETGQPELVAAAWRTLGMIGAQRACRWEPVACFTESLQLFTEIGMSGEQARTLRAWARYDIAQGDKARGQRHLAQALDRFTQLSMTKEVARTVAGQ